MTGPEAMTDDTIGRRLEAISGRLESAVNVCRMTYDSMTGADMQTESALDLLARELDRLNHDVSAIAQEAGRAELEA